PIRAHIISTAAISGHVRRAVQRSLVPSCAPATEYVAIPDGSSSAAPVITPGPSDFHSNRIHRAGTKVDTKKLERKPPTNHGSDPLIILHGAPYESLTSEWSIVIRDPPWRLISCGIVKK